MKGIKKHKRIFSFILVVTLMFTSSNLVRQEVQAENGASPPIVNSDESWFTFEAISGKDGYKITGYTTGSATELVIPSYYQGAPVLEIGNSVFDWENLTNVVLPEKIEKIGMAAFSQNKLTSITFPETLTDLGVRCFQGNQLTSIKIPAGVTSIETGVFSSNLLTSVEFHENLTEVGYESFKGNKLASIKLPSSLTNIEDWAFSGNKLITVTLPEKLEHIGYHAFGNNEIAGEIIIPETVTWIEGSAFVNNNITHVTMNVYPKNLENAAFSSNDVMAVTLPKDISVINVDAFEFETALVAAVKTGVDQWEINLKDADPKLDSKKVKFTKPSIGIRYDETTGILYANDYAMSRVMTYQYYIKPGGNLAIPEVRLSKGKSYLVVFNDSSGTEVSREIVKAGESATAPTPPVKDGMTFIGWDKSFDKISDYTVVTAKYDVNLYSVNYETGFEDIIIDKKENVKWDDADLLPEEPKKDNYQFLGWQIDSKPVLTTSKYSELTTNQTNGSSITLTAIWEDVADYSVLYNANGGFLTIQNSSILTGLKYNDILPLPIPLRDGYTFKGWTFQNTPVKDNSTYGSLAKDISLKEIELIAKWEINKSLVKYEFLSKSPNGINPPDNITVEYSTAITEPTISVPTDWEFDGWYTDRECTQKFDFTTIIKTDITLYGEWSYKEKPIKPENPSQPSKPGQEITNDAPVKTSDTTGYIVYMATLMISVLSLCIVKKQKKKLKK